MFLKVSIELLCNAPTNQQQHQQQPPTRLNAPPLPHQQSTYSQQTQESTYSQQGDGAYGASANAPPVPPVPQGQVEYVQPSPTSNLSNPDFLSRVEAVKADIRTLTTHVGQIATLHQQSISSADNVGASNALESMVTQTQVLNTSIKDQIKYLETDAARSQGNTVKDTQIRQLKTSFTKQLQEYRQEEANYERRYREQIARQYRIVNPEATESEVQEAMGADWGNEGVFQTAVSQPKTRRDETANPKLTPTPSSKPTAPPQPTPSSAMSAHATTTSKKSSAQ
jgi:syntaxin 1B/2/3